MKAAGAVGPQTRPLRQVTGTRVRPEAGCVKYQYDPAKKSRASKAVWERRRAEGRDKQSPELVARRVASTRANRLAARAAMSPEERREAAMKEREARAARSRRGWRTRRLRLGKDPDRHAPATRPVNVYVCDVEAVRTFHPNAREGIHLALEGLQLAVEVGTLTWTGDGWTIGPQDGRGEARGGEELREAGAEEPRP